MTGFLLAVFLGIFLAILAYWSKTVEILTAPVIAVVKSTPVASFYYFVPDMDSFEKSVSFYFLSYGSAGDIYKYP